MDLFTVLHIEKKKNNNNTDFPAYVTPDEYSKRTRCTILNNKQKNSFNSQERYRIPPSPSVSKKRTLSLHTHTRATFQPRVHGKARLGGLVPATRTPIISNQVPAWRLVVGCLSGGFPLESFVFFPDLRSSCTSFT